MADFMEIVKKHAGEDGDIPASAINTLVTAIRNTVGNEYVEKERYKEKLTEIDTLKAEKRIEAVLRVSDVDGVELDDKGQIKGAEKLSQAIKAEWADFIPTTHTEGAPTPTPPANTGGAMSRDEIFKIQDAGERQKAIADNIELFQKGMN